MDIGALPPIGGAAQSRPADRPAGAAPGFGDALARGLDEVSRLEKAADAATESFATGGPVEIHDVMIAASKASIGVDLLVQVRNRAVEAYQEIMRLQV